MKSACEDLGGSCEVLGCEDERESCLGAERIGCRVLVLPGRKD
jgi:hypothetical protein